MMLMPATPTPFPFAQASGDVPVLQNTLGSLADVQSSDIGVDGATAGTVTFSTVDSRDACYTGTARNNKVYFNDGTTILANNDLFSISVYMRPTFSCTNGVTSGSHLIFGLNDDGGVGDPGDWMLFTAASYYRIDNSITASLKTPTGFSFSADTWQHFGIVKNRAGIDGGSDTIRIYIDNVKKWSTTQAIASNSTAMESFVLGSYDENTSSSSAGAETYFSELKIFDKEITDFSGVM